MTTHLGRALLIPFVLAFAPARGEEPAVTREAVCRWTAAAPKIDGKLDDPAWKTAAVIDRFPAFWLGTTPGPAHATRARLLWDDQALYFAAEMTDAELRAFGTKHNDHLWNGDVFEMFLKPSKSRPAYYEFQVNPRGVLFEVAFPERGAKVGEFGALPELGMSAAVTLNGTLDHPGDHDHGWTVEGRIPWSTFAPTGGRPAPGAAWSFAICRYDFGPEGTKPVLMSSAPLTQPSFHRHEDFGRLIFEKKD
jgi:Carbohydrate family 9 binding domain-like